MTSKRMYYPVIILIFPILIQSQRRNYFENSDKSPNCTVLKKGFFKNEDSNTDSASLPYQIKINKNHMTEVYGNSQIIIKSRVKYLEKCKFEKEIIKIRSKLDINESLYKIGGKTVYELVETSPNYIILEFWCNEGRNICTEILNRK